jgi:hypothetical protein
MAEKKINGRTFKTSPLLATAAIVLQARLANVAGPALSRFGEIFAGAGPNASAEDKARANGAAIAAFCDIFSKTDPHALAALVKDIVETAQIQRPSGYDAIDFDGDFSGEHLKDVIPVGVWVLREQFGDFFSGLTASGSLVKPGGA